MNVLAKPYTTQNEMHTQHDVNPHKICLYERYLEVAILVHTFIIHIAVMLNVPATSYNNPNEMHLRHHNVINSHDVSEFTNVISK